MKKTTLLLTLGLLVSVLSYGQRNDRGLNFGNTRLPANLEGIASWDLLTDFSDDFNHNSKDSPRFRNVWSESYRPDPGFRGPGQTQWVIREPGGPAFGNIVDVRNGQLEIRAFPGENGLVNCGIISSNRTVRFPVYMEARIRVSNIRNSSNFWMLNPCDNEEIDVLEVYGGDPDQFFSKQMSTNYHIWHRQGGQSHAGAQTNVNCGGLDITDFTYQTFFTTNPNSANLNDGAFWRDDFHTFGVYWASPTQLEFYIDGQPRFNGQHFVSGRNASGLNGSFRDARMQCPNAEVLRCATSDLLRNVQGQSGGGVRYPNREFNDPTHIILDTEAHAGRVVETANNLNNNNRNVMRVDWVRVYRPTFNSGGGNPAPAPTPTPAPAPAPAANNGATQFRYDIGTNGSPVFNQYTRVSNTTRSQANGFGWANTNDIGSRDRGGAPGRNNINRDINFSAQTRFFTQNLSNGNWNVLVTFGDTFRRRNMNVGAEGGNQLTNINTNAGQYLSRSFNVQVNDGRLDLRFSVGNGGDVWSITRIWIRRVGTNGAKELIEITNNDNAGLLSVYPNPVSSNNSVTISGATVGGLIEIYNTNGQKVNEVLATSENQEITLGALSSGLYFVRSNGSTIKLIVK